MPTSGVLFSRCRQCLASGRLLDDKNGTVPCRSTQIQTITDLPCRSLGVVLSGFWAAWLDASSPNVNPTSIPFQPLADVLTNSCLFAVATSFKRNKGGPMLAASVIGLAHEVARGLSSGLTVAAVTLLGPRCPDCTPQISCSCPSTPACICGAGESSRQVVTRSPGLSGLGLLLAGLLLAALCFATGCTCGFLAFGGPRRPATRGLGVWGHGGAPGSQDSSSGGLRRLAQ